MCVVLWQVFIKQKCVTSQLKLLHSGKQCLLHPITFSWSSSMPLALFMRGTKELKMLTLGSRERSGGLHKFYVVGKSHLLGTATAGTRMLFTARPGPAAPPCGQPQNWGCWRALGCSTGRWLPPPCWWRDTGEEKWQGDGNGQEMAKSLPEVF